MTSRRIFLKVMGSLPFASSLLPSHAMAQASSQAPQKTPPDQMAGSPVGDPLPGQAWKVHDRARPQSRKVVPGLPIPTMRAASDAIILFDGKDLSSWSSVARDGKLSDPKWKVENDYFEMVPRSGSLVTKEAFGDCQLHLEWMTPAGTPLERVGQMRGNSGVILMRRYEIQVLSSYDNITYADGAAGGIYGLYPPMVNPCRPEGEWNEYDIIFNAPRFEGEKLLKPAALTLIFNGLVVHHHAELLGTTDTLPIAKYEPHAAEEPFLLQGHAGPVRYRNIWIRRLAAYDK